MKNNNISNEPIVYCSERVDTDMSITLEQVAAVLDGLAIEKVPMTVPIDPLMIVVTVSEVLPPPGLLDTIVHITDVCKRIIYTPPFMTYDPSVPESWRAVRQLVLSTEDCVVYPCFIPQMTVLQSDGPMSMQIIKVAPTNVLGVMFPVPTSATSATIRRTLIGTRLRKSFTPCVSLHKPEPVVRRAMAKSAHGVTVVQVAMSACTTGSERDYDVYKFDVTIGLVETHFFAMVNRLCVVGFQQMFKQFPIQVRSTGLLTFAKYVKRYYDVCMLLLYRLRRASILLRAVLKEMYEVDDRLLPPHTEKLSVLKDRLVECIDTTIQIFVNSGVMKMTK